MNISGKVVTSTIAVVAVVNLVYFFSLTNSVSITGLFFTILIIFFSWDFGRKYDTTIKLYDSIKVVNEKLQKEKLELTIKYEDYEQFFTSFDEAIFFSYNYNNHQAMFSKGIEKLIGYTQTEFNNNKDILKQIVHNEDFLEFNKALRELKHGKPVRKEL